MRVLPLNSYDLILGMDWLKSYSPMQVHWIERWMPLPYQGTQILLQDFSSLLPNGSGLI
jgi:hypothetical protein